MNNNFDELPTKEREALNVISSSMDKFYTLPPEKRQVALDNITLLNNHKPLSHLKG